MFNEWCGQRALQITKLSDTQNSKQAHLQYEQKFVLFYCIQTSLFTSSYINK